ncbi:hypothetical protein BDY17DRAFT_321963 [Neohortaea acidophila]|uniref:DUF7918 domain-containing protein n=1 Tax=Neohortaea acidophila TaxID=245834 RepID=A0A6A6PYL7_9PEZI|nr:uncharacterized protein BDY17DRAFT_321963 [Neohortaea acidophila]KAF2485095.1 hypothetical protein BDY17DRAFT_321963 [Neohortaea acidophila]
MPTYKNVTVQVTNATEVPLAEWGIRKLDRVNLTTCYIQSETDLAFRIRINPSIPWRADEWHFLATLRIDGRQTPERRRIVRLDNYDRPSRRYRDEDFDGEVIIKSRTVKDADGTVRVCGWQFKDVGIEAVFDRLLVSSEQEDEEELIAAMGGTALDDSEEKSKVGQIEVALERVTLGATRYEAVDAGARDQPNLAGDTRQVTHTVALDAGHVAAGGARSVIDYRPFDAPEAPYATFRFYYRSEDVLRKFGFAHFPAAKPSIKRERKDASGLTPLRGKTGGNAPKDAFEPRKPVAVEEEDEADEQEGAGDGEGSTAGAEEEEGDNFPQSDADESVRTPLSHLRLGSKREMEPVGSEAKKARVEEDEEEEEEEL